MLNPSRNLPRGHWEPPPEDDMPGWVLEAALHEMGWFRIQVSGGYEWVRRVYSMDGTDMEHYEELPRKPIYPTLQRKIWREYCRGRGEKP